MKEDDFNPSKTTAHNHNWMFEQIIRSEFGPRESLKQVLNKQQLSLIDINQATLLSTKSTSPEKTLQDSDALIQVPIIGEKSSAVRIRFLVEHKSSIRIQQLASQLLRYQYGHYETSKEPIVTVVINNGPVSKHHDSLSFQDQLDNPGDAFWQAYGEYVLNFNALILNLQDPKIQHGLLASESPAALGLYAMGAADDNMSEQDGLTLLRKSQELDRIGINQVWLPILYYLNFCHPELTIDWWKKLEQEQTGRTKVMAMALSVSELLRQEGRQEGIEEGRMQGIVEGRQEGIESVAKSMLQCGLDEKFVSEHTHLSPMTIQNLKDNL